MPAVGITDHGSMAGAIELYRTAGKAGIKPLLGCEIYLVDDRRSRVALEPARLEPPDAAGRDDGRLPQPHQALHARLPRGLLLQAARRLRAARDLRRRHHRALGLPLRAHLLGAARRATWPARARSSTASCRSSGARTSTSSCRTRASTSTRASTRASSRWRPTTGLPVVGTGDVHYLRAEDAAPHEALLCIQTNDLLSNPNRFRFSTQDFYLKTPEEMSRTMAPWGGDGLLAPTLEIAERCNVVLDLERIHLPRFDEAGDDSFGMLRRPVRGGHARALRRRSTSACATASSSSSRRSARWASPTTS